MIWGKIKHKRGKQTQVKTTIPTQQSIDQITQLLSKQIDKKIFLQKYAKVGDVLKLVGMGLFLGASIVIPNLPRAFAPYFKSKETNAWKRFNIPYLKRTLKRLEKQKLVEISEENGFQVVKITEVGKLKILKAALKELAVEKPKIWKGTWWLVSYDLPKDVEHQRDFFRSYLKNWGFYPLHESVFLHAYPCYKQVNFLREYLRIGEYVRIFEVSPIENSRLFKEFFGV